MIRTQIQLTPQQMASLREEADKAQVSIAEVIRRSIDASLAVSSVPQRGEMKRHALAAAGQFASGSTNVSADHDRYLDEAFGAVIDHP